MSEQPGILRLPAELRLQITQYVLCGGPDPCQVARSNFCCLEEWLHDYIRHRYAILEVPGFTLRRRFPHAFKQDAVVIAFSKDHQGCFRQKRRVEEHFVPGGRNFWCFRLRQRFPLSNAVIEHSQWYHVDVISAGESDTVHLITDVSNTFDLRKLVGDFMDRIRPQSIKLNVTIMARWTSEKLNMDLLYHFFGDEYGRGDPEYPRSLQGACTMMQDLLNGEQIWQSRVEMSGVGQVKFEIIDPRFRMARAIQGRFEREKSSDKFVQNPLVQKVNTMQIDAAPAEGPTGSNGGAATKPPRLYVDQKLCKVNGEATWQIPSSGWVEVAPVALSILSFVMIAVLAHLLLVRPLILPMARGCFGSLQHHAQNRMSSVTPTTVSWVQPTKPVLSPSPSTNRRGHADTENTHYMMVYSHGMSQLYAYGKKDCERPQTPRQGKTDFARADPSMWVFDDSATWSPLSVGPSRNLVVAREVQQVEDVCPVQTDVCKVTKSLHRAKAERASGASWVMWERPRGL